MYEKLCKAANLPPKQFLTDVTLYEDVKILTVSSMLDRILEETEKLPGYQLRFKRKREEILETKRKKTKLIKDARPPCEKCSSKELLVLYSKACDNNWWELPSGKTGEGYMPSFPALGMEGGDGLGLTVCVDCGWIQGFDSALVKAELENVDVELETYEDLPQKNDDE